MQTKRLDNVLARNKKRMTLDVLLAVALVVALGLAALAFITKVPALAPDEETSRSAPIVMVDDDSASRASATARMLADAGYER